MTFSIELQPHEVDMIMTALCALGGKYNAEAKKDSESGKVDGFRLNRANADEVFGLVCKLPDLTPYCDEIAKHTVEVAMKAWPGFLSC